MQRLVLLGLDFGSTTSHAIVATAELARSCLSGRMELVSHTVRYRSPSIFTPFVGELLDLSALSAEIDGWLAAAALAAPELRPEGSSTQLSFAGGGAIVTGLAALAQNVAGLRALVGQRISSALVATADDPQLESWLAFQGNCSVLCQQHPEQTFLNLDIGGGTTNLAVGCAGRVMKTAVAAIGARHLRCQPGSYRVSGVSQAGAAQLTRLGIDDSLGRDLRASELAAYLSSLVTELEALVMRCDPGGAAITFSGGVGELLYRASAGGGWPERTAYGDLGIDLAAAILASPLLARDVYRHRPQTLGRATACGLALHHVEVSGTTIFLPEPQQLPRADLPIVARLPYDAPVEELAAALRLGGRGHGGIAVALTGMPPSAAASTGRRILAALPAEPVSLVLLLEGNGGKTLGHYATDWGQAPYPLIVLDEVEIPEALFVTLGRLQHSVVPVSFYGYGDSRKAT